MRWYPTRSHSRPTRCMSFLSRSQASLSHLLLVVKAQNSPHVFALRSCVVRRADQHVTHLCSRVGGFGLSAQADNGVLVNADVTGTGSSMYLDGDYVAEGPHRFVGTPYYVDTPITVVKPGSHTIRAAPCNANSICMYSVQCRAMQQKVL